jgi:roadblock/LC7 domain-containing protein
VAGPSNETNPQLSPDGTLVAYQSDQSGDSETYVTAVPGPGPRVPVSIGGGRYPRWSPDGSRLYYRGGVDLHVATIVERPELAVTRREVIPDVRLTDDQEFNYAPMPNGMFLTTPGPPAPPASSQISVITNWQSLFRNR